MVFDAEKSLKYNSGWITGCYVVRIRAIEVAGIYRWNKYVDERYSSRPSAAM